MRVVVDANIVAAALVRPGGWTATQLARRDVEFVAPQFLEGELAEHEAEYAQKAHCSVAEWRARTGVVLASLRLVPAHRLRGYARHELMRAIERVDPEDAPYVATYLAARADFLWTRDGALPALLGERAGPILPSDVP